MSMQLATLRQSNVANAQLKTKNTYGDEERMPQQRHYYQKDFMILNHLTDIKTMFNLRLI
jgi:hypothetical protein